MKRRQRNGKKIAEALVIWLIFLGYLIIISPSSIISFTGFYVLLSLALFLTFKSILSLARTLVGIVTILIFLFLQQLHINNPINTVILIGIFVTLEIYFRKA